MAYVPPHNIEAEQAVLCTMMMDKETSLKLQEELRQEDFYRESHRVIFKAIVELLDKNQQVDMITLGEMLKERGQLTDVGDYAYLMQLNHAVPTSAGWEEHASIVHQCAVKRLLAQLGRNMAIRSQGDEDAETQVEKALEGVMEIATDNKELGFVDAETLVGNALEGIMKRMDSGEYYLGVGTGFTAFDDVTSGLQAGDLIILAARPSMGKTAMAMSLIMCMLSQDSACGPTVGLFSLEMSSEQLICRMLSALANVDGQALNRGKLKSYEWNYVYDAANRLAATKLFIDDSSSINLRTIRSRSRRLQAEHGLAAIFIDYLQLLPGPPGGRENRQQEISVISRQLKSLAKELHVPVIALSQLSRAVEGRTNKRPTLSDIRDSGSIEQDSDVVCFLYRDEYYNPDTTNEPHVCELHIAKHRNGPTSTMKFYVDLAKNQFFEIV